MRAYQRLERPSVILMRIVMPRLYDRDLKRIRRELGMQQRRTYLQVDYVHNLVMSVQAPKWMLTSRLL